MTPADAMAFEVIGAARHAIGGTEASTTLVVRCFKAVGIALDDDILVLHLAGEKIVGSELLAADLVFRTGRRDAYHDDDRRLGVGHVGIFTGDGTVVHASPWLGRVAEEGIGPFIDEERGKFRGVRRIIARP